MVKSQLGYSVYPDGRNVYANLI